MRLGEVQQLVDSTSDAAFAVDSSGLIVAWNRTAEEMFRKSADEVVGKPCGQILQGTNERGPVCSRDCTIQQAVHKGHPIHNFDIQLKTSNGVRWCNVSILVAKEVRPSGPYSIHIVRSIDTGKRLEILFRDFAQSQSGGAGEGEMAGANSNRSPIAETDLTRREVEILRLLAKGETTVRVAAQLHISRTTVNNHIQHVLRKLNVHTRLEAIRRAEYAGLI
ncbi:MAG: LuxR C-terminal-related transcriptional regulator [Terriglobia bacterium]